MTADEIREFFDRRAGLWRSRDAEALAADYADEAVLVSPLLGTSVGRAAIGQSFRGLFGAFPDWTLATTNLMVDAENVAQVVSITATHTNELFGLPATNKRVDIQAVIVYRLVGAAIAHEERIYDFTRFLIELGVLRSRPA